MTARAIAKRVYPIAGSVAVGAFVYIWLTTPKKK